MIPPARQIERAGGELAKQIVIIVIVAAGTAAAIVGLERVDLGPAWVNVVEQAVFAAGGVACVLTQSYARRALAFISVRQWRAIDAESEPAHGNPQLRVLIVMLTCAISLTLQEYYGGADRYAEWFPYDGGEYWELMGFVWWSAWRVVGYVVIPMVVIACTPGERIRDYYVTPRGFFRHLWIYGVMFVAFSPIVIVASMTDSFRDTYPFYRMANRSHFDLWAWESMYIVQFMALEFFFRGFLLQGLRRVLGSNAIFVMIVPYCMIHYGKPLPETIGAIGAGLVLGTLAMRTRSIWGGILIHVGVAMSMDVLALQGCPPIGSDYFCHP